MKNLLKSALEYLKHDSTWKGIISLITALGVTLTPEQSAAVMASGLAAVGLIQVFWTDADKTK
jgi:hypothetical protein